MSPAASRVDASAPILARITEAATKSFTGSIDVTAKVGRETRQITVWMTSGQVYAVHSPQYTPPAHRWAEVALGAPLPRDNGEPEHLAYSMDGTRVTAEMIDAARRDWAYGLLAASLTWQRPSVKLHKRKTTESSKFEPSSWQRLITDLSARVTDYERAWEVICAALAARNMPMAAAAVVAPRLSVILPGHPSFHTAVGLDALAADAGRSRASVVIEIGRALLNGATPTFGRVAAGTGGVLVPEALEDPEAAFAPAPSVVMPDAHAQRDVASLIDVDTSTLPPSPVGDITGVDPDSNPAVEFPSEFLVGDAPKTPLLAQLAHEGGFDPALMDLRVALPEPEPSSGAPLPPPETAIATGPALRDLALGFDELGPLPSPEQPSMDDLAAPLSAPIDFPELPPLPPLPVFDEPVSEGPFVSDPFAGLPPLPLLDVEEPALSPTPALPASALPAPVPAPPVWEVPSQGWLEDIEPSAPAPEYVIPEVVRDTAAGFDTHAQSVAPYPTEVPAPITPVAAPLVAAPPPSARPADPTPALSDPRTWLGGGVQGISPGLVEQIMRRVRASVIEETTASIYERGQAEALARAARAELARAEGELHRVEGELNSLIDAHADKQRTYDVALAAHQAKTALTEAVRNEHAASVQAAQAASATLDELLAQVAQAQIALESAQRAADVAATRVASADADLAATTAPAVQQARADLERFERETILPAQDAVSGAQDEVDRLRTRASDAVSNYEALVRRVEEAQALLSAFADN